jgi:DNA-binding response OmpR family regulator
MQKILIIEDDTIINNGIKVYLENHGYETVSAYTTAEAKNALKIAFSLILIDINLPDGDGLNLCQAIRQTSDVPIIFLTANDTEENMIAGFEHGCDDYISKPFSVSVLEQRIKAVLRRSQVQTQSFELFSYKGLMVDFKRMSVTSDGAPVKLSATEFKLLRLLIKNKGQVLTRNTLLEKIWDCDENYIDDNTLSVHIRRLRQKLEPNPKNPQYIITVFGIGYTFGE